MFANTAVVVFRFVVLIVAIPGLASAAYGADLLMVVCAPGYPGSTAEAQPAMDGLASVVASAAGWDPQDFEAVYFETEEGGLARLAEDDAGLAMLTLPFFLEHREALGLRPVMLAVPSGNEPLESWVLVAGAGAVHEPADLGGWQLISLAGHSPRFIRGPALGDWGELPQNLAISMSGAVLSSLRKAAKGEPITVLLDAEQAGAMDRLPFAGDLEVIHRSRPLPVSVLCAVGDRVEPAVLDEIATAFEGLDEQQDAAEALAGVRLDRFVPVDPVALSSAEDAFDGVDE